MATEEKENRKVCSVTTLSGLLMRATLLIKDFTRLLVTPTIMFYTRQFSGGGGARPIILEKGNQENFRYNMSFNFH